MMSVVIKVKEGWDLFWQALPLSRFGSLDEAAEWMYRLNIYAHSLGRHPITSQIYSLKNKLIKYFYQHGYSTEILLHIQAFDCWGVGGVCDDDCPKCGGTGIFRTEKLYSFRFDIHGRRYAWHQPAKLIDYPVELTDHKSIPFIEPSRQDQAILSHKEAWSGCCIVWWALALHGVLTDLLLFDALRNRSRIFIRSWVGIPREVFAAIKRRYQLRGDKNAEG